jgi:murein DD-endopeptidase MepM/ murein hydrolase activator NlpD
MTEVFLLKKYNSEKTKKIIYSTCATALCGATLFAFWFSNKGNVPIEDETLKSSTAETTTEREIQVNTPATNVQDDRYITTTTEEAPKSVYYAFPLGNKVSKEYSKGELIKNKTTDDWRTHNGVDINGAIGDTVKAICDGEVTEVREDARWGTVVTINHSNGIVAVYYGLQKDSIVKTGSTVDINQKIGTLGEIPIEKDDGIHLHLEIFKDGNLVSPSDYLGKRVDI